MHTEAQALVTIAAVNARVRVAVLGLGGIGGMLAARTGALCVGTHRTVAAIRDSGLTLVHPGGTLVAHVEATETLQRPVALLVVAVKAYDLDAALDRIEPSAVLGATVLPLLNGIEHVDAIRARVQGATVVAASIGRVEAYSAEPGLVVQRTSPAQITAASHELGHTALDAALEPLRVPGVEVVLETDERAVLWAKATRLSVLAAATVASGRSVGDLREDPLWRERLQTALGEAVRVAEADGVGLHGADQWAIIESLPPDFTSSTARDAAAGRPTELDAITGSVVRAGRRLGVATPELTALLEEAACRVPLH
jgi:2-dehydropantoate 2-reductase